MAMYPKGAYKWDIILHNAKYLFYQKGIAATTIREIAELSGDPTSLVHYYFKKKEDIIQEIYHDFLGKIDLFVYSNVFSDEEELTVLLAHSVTQFIYYDIILNDPKNLQVYTESLVKSSNQSILNQYIDHVYRKIADELDVNISEDYFQAIVSMDFGSRRDLLQKYRNGEIKLTTLEVCRLLIKTFPLQLGLSQEHMDAILEKAQCFFEQMDYSHLKFLV